MSFKLYTNQEIYDLLNKKTASVISKRADFWSNIWPNIKDTFDAGIDDSIEAWYKILDDPAAIRESGIQPTALAPFRKAIMGLFESLKYLNHERGNPEAEQGYYDAIKNVHNIINSTEKDSPLYNYMTNKFNQLWTERITSKADFGNIDPNVLNKQIEYLNPKTNEVETTSASAIASSSPNAANATNSEVKPKETPFDINNWIYSLNYQEPRLNGALPKPFLDFQKNLLNVNTYLKQLNTNPKDETAKANYMQALSSMYSSLNADSLRGYPELAIDIGNSLKTYWDHATKEYKNIPANIINTPVVMRDINTGKDFTINKNSIITKANAMAKSVLASPRTKEEKIQKIDNDILNSKITPEQGEALKQNIEQKDLSNKLNRVLSGFEYKNPQQREQSLQEAERLMQKAIENENIQISDDFLNPFRDKMSTLATRFNVKSFTDKAFARQFGDLSTNPLYKKNPNALYKAFDEYSKFNPGMTLDEFIKDKVYANNADSSQIYAQQIADAKKLKGRGYYMGYDPETGEILYGSGANYTPMGKSTYKGFKRISADKSTYNSIINNANLSNYHQRLRKMRELGFDEEAARDIALRGAIKLYTTSWIDGRGSKEGFNPTIRSWNDRVGSDETIRQLNKDKDPSTQNKSNILTPKKPLPNQVTYYR